MDSLIKLTNDPDELQNISDIYAQQDFRVIEISKSGSNYNASPSKWLRPDHEQFSRTSYSTKLKSKYGYEKPNFPSLTLSKVSSGTSEISHLSINERRKTAEHAKIIVQQAEERTKGKLDLLERSCLDLFTLDLFELEKQRSFDEEFETKNNADLVALDANIDELNRSKFKNNFVKDLENIEQEHLEKHNSLESSTLKLKEKLTI